MDILRKMFKSQEEKANDEVTGKDEFRKPQWFEESETDDELFDDDRKFAFQIFTNPLELQKHFERQMEQVMEAISQFEGDDVKIEKNLKEEYLKPGFEGSILKEFNNSFMDTDLDGEIYSDQLHSLIQRLQPGEELPNIIPRNDNKINRKIQSKQKLSDEQRILGKIHGTLNEDEVQPRAPPSPPSRHRPGGMMAPIVPRSGVTPFSGVFEGAYQGPKMFSQSVMTKTVRKSDGTYETTKVTQDSQGNKTTTVTTRAPDGHTETVTSYDGMAGGGLNGGGGGGVGHNGNRQLLAKSDQYQVYSDRNIYVTKQGYAVPRNLW